MSYSIRLGLMACVVAGLLAQQPPPQQQQQQPGQRPPIPPPVPIQLPGNTPILTPAPGAKPQQQPAPAAQQPAAPAPQQPAPAQPAPAPAPVQTAPVQITAQPPNQGTTPVVSGLNLHNASLNEVIDQLARLLRINYILDPRVKGGVYLNTYGEMKGIDARNLLDIILRINGFGMVQVGDLYRIVPLSDISHLPLPAESKSQSKDIPADDQPMLNLVFLKYATVDELAKVLAEFNGEGARMITYSPANLLFILDSHRNMRRTMDLISMFDSDVLTNQRVRLFEVKHGRPSDIATELGNILKNVALTEKSAPIKFLPVDRINTIIAVAPNPGVFETVESWLKKLDVPIKNSGGAMDTYVYRVKYGRAECLGMALMELYGSFYGPPGYGTGFGGYGMGGYGMGGYGAGGYGAGGYGGGGGGYGAGAAPGATVGGANAGLGSAGGCGGMGGGGFGMGGYGTGGYGMGGYGGYPGGAYPGGYAPQYPVAASPFNGGAAPTGAQAGVAPVTGSGDLTGSYLGPGRVGAQAAEPMPRIVPNPLDNSLLIQATPAQYASILKLMDQLDIPPRQILLEAKIYEVSLTGAFASGVSAFLQQRGASNPGGLSGGTNTHQLTASLADGATSLSAGAFVGASRELLAFLSLQENATRARVLSAPSLIATDSIAASITVGNEVPTLTAQAPSNVQVGGNSTFAQSIQSRQTGVTLNVMAHVNPSGIVTLIINQEVSAPTPPPSSSAIQSPSFSKRSVQTQITMQDGDTIAIGGIINESSSSSTSGIPILHKLPGIGSAFGSKSYSKDRTELIVFMTPHVIYDNNDLQEASDELKARLKKLRKYVNE